MRVPKGLIYIYDSMILLICDQFIKIFLCSEDDDVVMAQHGEKRKLPSQTEDTRYFQKLIFGIHGLYL